MSFVALLWGAFGVFDFYMTKTGNEQYLKDFPAEMIDWIATFPMWRDALWAATIGAGLIGPVLLLFRSGLAALILWLGVAAMIVGFVGHDLLMADGAKYYGQAGLIASVVIVAISIAIAWYASRAKRQGYIG